MNGRTVWLGVIGVSVIVLTSCAPKSTEPQVEKSTAIPVTVASVQAKSIRRTIPVTGTLSAWEDITLSPKVDGRVVSAPYDLGDVAVPGAVLLELEAVDFENNVALERQTLQADLAKIGLSELPRGSLPVETLPEVQRAEATRVNARRTFERLRTLASSSRIEIDNAETELKVAEATKRAAITMAEATLATAQMRKKSLDIAEQRLRDTQLRVPVPSDWGAWAALVGPAQAPQYSIAAKMVSEGEMVRSFPGTNAYRLVSWHRLKLRVNVPERFTPDVRLGQRVEVRVEAFAEETFPGEIIRINPAIEASTRTFQIEAAIPNGSGRLKPGNFARANTITGTADILTVPPLAVVVFAGVSKVFVQQGNSVKSVPIEVGERDNDWVEVRGALNANDAVITSGTSQLYDGAAVRLR